MPVSTSDAFDPCQKRPTFDAQVYVIPSLDFICFLIANRGHLKYTCWSEIYQNLVALVIFVHLVEEQWYVKNCGC